MTIPERLTESAQLIRWLDEKINGVSVSSELRFRIAGGCLDVALEHHKAIVVLVDNDLYGSALALVRLILEAYVRGVWLHRCADERALRLFERNKLEREFRDLIADIEKVPGFDIGILSAAMKRSWKSMNSFTHTGFHQVVRRNKQETIEPNYDDDEMLEAIGFADAIAMLAAVEIAQLAGNQALATEVFDKAKLVLPEKPHAVQRRTVPCNR